MIRAATLAALAVTYSACGRSTCDDFVTLNYTVAGYDTSTCALVLTAGSARAEYDFPPPVASSPDSCSACAMSTCTTVSGPAPSYCAWTADTSHDAIAIQFEAPSVNALESYLGASTFSVAVTCGSTPLAASDPGSVQCLPTSAE